MAYAYTEQPWSGRRVVGLFGAIAVNVALIGAISGGLNFDFEKIIPPTPIQIVTIATVTPTEPVEIPEPVVTESKPEIDFPRPPVEIPLEPVETPLITAPIDLSPSQPISPPMETQLQADPRHPLTPPMYPPSSIRRNEQGVVTLLIYVMNDGRVGDVRIKRSSGFPKLDEAAVTVARRDWRFQPATQGGASVATWGQYAVTFELTGQE